jgi:hypothetical protein
MVFGATATKDKPVYMASGAWEVKISSGEVTWDLTEDQARSLLKNLKEQLGE